MPTFFRTLFEKTESERQSLYNIPQIIDALTGNISKQEYLSYLEQAYHHVKHTSPLLMLTGSRISHDKEWLRVALAEYIEEELGHQEWILNDIKSAGGDAEKVRHGEPNAATEVMVAYAYDYVSRINPVGFFGMAFVLEGTSKQLATNAVETLKQSLELPESCFSYLSSHGSLDIEHMKFFEKLVNKIDNPADQHAIIHMAKRMFVLYGNVFRSIPRKGLEVRDAA